MNFKFKLTTPTLRVKLYYTASLSGMISLTPRPTQAPSATSSRQNVLLGRDDSDGDDAVSDSESA